MRVNFPYRHVHATVRFLIGREAGGRWLVCDGDGLVSGVFADRGSAVRAAMYDCAGAPCSVCCLPEHQILAILNDLAEKVMAPSVDKHRSTRIAR
ncbi:hypothetical protein [Rhizobium oryzicola]|uniref:Uncharacterized protein n=1 Tax=Rhizobium oryzicola TaxID=1232668 RepID=A0ABT8SU12_9HYPH|nr:hypothetical protein [Rhizobium oryzicola]MDO1581846.1 hypothetical protein [Rhizobium oryzicola]